MCACVCVCAYVCECACICVFVCACFEACFNAEHIDFSYTEGGGAIVPNPLKRDSKFS